MKKFTSILLALTLVLALMVGCAQPAATQTESTAPDATSTEAPAPVEGSSDIVAPEGYPDKNINWIVPAAAGAIIDQPSRIVADMIDLGTNIVIENIAGASQVTGTTEAANRDADGYTILTGANAAMITQPLLLEDLPYDPADFEPLALLVPGTQQILCSRNDSEIKTVDDFIAYAKDNADFTWTASNPGSIGHILGTHALNSLDLNLGTYVPFSGTAEVLQAILNGSVDFAILESKDAKNQSDQGQVNMIAVLDGGTYQYAPEVPTMADYGVEGLEKFAAWYFVAVKKDTPEDIKEYLRLKFQEVVFSEEYQAYLTESLLTNFDETFDHTSIEEWRVNASEANREVMTELGMIE